MNQSTGTTSPIRIRQTKRDKIKFNIMVVGETGLGKTTFLNSLLRRYIDNFSLPLQTTNQDDSKSIEITNLGKFEILTDTGDGLDIVLYDSPGFGDAIDNTETVNKVRQHILQAHQAWKRLDFTTMTEAEFLQSDDRIHCIFYFIAPHRLKAIDLDFFRELSPLVPIVPVVAKADIMTIKERNYYLEAIKQKLDALSEEMKESCVYDFLGDDIVTLGADAADQPVTQSKSTELIRTPNLFAIVCDNGPERVYPWGKLRIDDHKVSDFRRLQTILFESEFHIKGMLDNTRKKSIRLAKATAPAV